MQLYSPQYYKDKSKEEIKNDVAELGFNPILINNSPNYVYSPHTHPETKLLAIVDGRMDVKVEGDSYILQPGDRLMIEGNIEHSAVVGSEGCSFYWAEKVL